MRHLALVLALSFATVAPVQAQTRAYGYHLMSGGTARGSVSAFAGAQRLLALESTGGSDTSAAVCIDWFMEPPDYDVASSAPTPVWVAPRELAVVGDIGFLEERGQTAIWNASEIAAIRTGDRLPEHGSGGRAASAWVRAHGIDVGLFTIVPNGDQVTTLSVERGELRIRERAPSLERIAAGATDEPWSGLALPAVPWLGEPLPPSSGRDASGVLLAATVESDPAGVRDATRHATFRRASRTGRFYGTSTELTHYEVNDGALRALQNRRRLAESNFDIGRVRLAIDAGRPGASVPTAVAEHARARMQRVSTTATASDVVMVVADGSSDISAQLTRLGNLSGKVVILVACVGTRSGIGLESARELIRQHDLAAVAIYDGAVDAVTAINAINAVFESTPPGTSWDAVLQRLMAESTDAANGGTQFGVILSRLTILSGTSSSA